MKCWTFCDLFQIKNYTYTHKFWIPHIFSILVSFLFNFSLKKLRFVSFRFPGFCWSVCFQVSETNILRCIWLDRKNLTTCILLFKVVLTQLSTSFSGPRRLALAWISLFFLVVHASTSIFTTVGYLAALTRSSNRQYVVKKLFRTRIWMHFGIITKMCSANFRARCKISDQKLIAVSMKM